MSDSKENHDFRVARELELYGVSYDVRRVQPEDLLRDRLCFLPEAVRERSLGGLHALVLQNPSPLIQLIRDPQYGLVQPRIIGVRFISALGLLRFCGKKIPCQQPFAAAFLSSADTYLQNRLFSEQPELTEKKGAIETTHALARSFVATYMDFEFPEPILESMRACFDHVLPGFRYL